jgi:hypothetical protein
MLDAVDPLVQRIEALPKRGSYAVTLVLDDGQERILVVTLVDGAPVLPAANRPEGWAADSQSARALLSAVSALHDARAIAGAGRAQLVDIDGGWDVSIGNVTLAENGEPQCVSHGAMALEDGVWTCPECGAAAMFASD